jgi:ADP-ribosylglycohydrolase
VHALVHASFASGHPLDAALDLAARILRRQPRHDETLAALDAARELAAQGNPSPERVESLGAGWIAEEALAIAVYAALVHREKPKAALLLAANHSGDSDTTAALCGNLLGALHGEAALPRDWLALLEGRATIERLADDFVAEMTDDRPREGTSATLARADVHRLTSPQPQDPDFAAWWERYPGW